jgi:hydrogenase maturation protease
VTTLILALGNPLLGDDGIGAAVLAALPAPPADVVLLDGGTPGLDLVLRLQGHARVIILDAADMGEPPGTWRWLTPDDLRGLDPLLRGNLHSAGLAEALRLGEALGILPPEIRILAIQPAELGWSPGLSPEVEHTIPAARNAVLDFLNSKGHRAGLDADDRDGASTEERQPVLTATRPPARESRAREIVPDREERAGQSRGG